MPHYRLLKTPGTSAVFFGASEPLSLAELTLCLPRLETACQNPRTETDAGLSWLSFDAEAQLTPADLSRLSRLTFLYALFQAEGDLLRPVPVPSDAIFPDDLSAILKYTGKTNPLFTRLMLHLAECSLRCTPKSRIRLLDPVAGKGTTLFESLMRGHEASGIEIVPRAAHDAAVYFQKYLETEKWRHKVEPEKRHGAACWRFTFAREKDALKENPGRLTLVAGDAKDIAKFYGKTAFEIIAGDLPYGVAHGNVTGAALQRSPEALLTACLPAWRTALVPGGVLALSWNTRVFPREAMLALLNKNGLMPLNDPPYDALSHRVDASIQRDIAIAVREG